MLGFADQAVSSATNFGLTIVVARAVDPEGFGRFAVVLGVVTVVLGVTRAVAAEPFVVRRLHLDRRVAVGRVVGAALVVGALGAVVLAAVGAALGGAWAAPTWAAAVVVPALAVQDAVRLVLLAEGRSAAALVGDLTWAGGLVVGVAVAAAVGEVDGATGLLAWGCSSALAGVLGVVQLRARPAPMALPEWLGQMRRWWPTFVAEFLLTAAGFQVALALVSAIEGPAAAAGLRGGQTAFGPLSVLFLAGPAVLVAEVGRTAPAQRARLCRRIGAGFASAAAATGALLLVLPDGAGEAVLGGSWDATRPLLPALTLYFVSVGANLGAFVRLRAEGAVRSSRRVRITSTVLMVTGVAVGAVAAGAEGAAGGLAVANVSTTVLWWRAATAIPATAAAGGQDQGPQAPPTGPGDGP